VSRLRRALGRTALNKTLITGWWGIISFFMNLGYVAHDAAALREMNALAAPQPPSPRRLDPGRPVFHRAGALIGLSVLVVAAAFVVNVVKGPDHKVVPSAWVVGACVNVTGVHARAVHCTDSHDGRVTQVVRSLSECGGGLGAVTVQHRVYCVERDSGAAN
jgi:hypothetical protein